MKTDGGLGVGDGFACMVNSRDAFGNTCLRKSPDDTRDNVEWLSGLEGTLPGNQGTLFGDRPHKHVFRCIDDDPRCYRVSNSEAHT